MEKDVVCFSVIKRKVFPSLVIGYFQTIYISWTVCSPTCLLLRHMPWSNPYVTVAFDFLLGSSVYLC